VSPNAQRALSVLGEDFSDEELKAMKAVLDVLRNRSAAGFSAPHRSDLVLPQEHLTEIRQHALGVLRELDAVRTPEPVEIDDALVVAKLVRAGAIELTLEEKKRLWPRFKEMVDWAVHQFQGIVHLDRGEVYINETLYEQKRRFVEGHEIGHAVLPDHKAAYAHLEDKQRLTDEFNDLLERQANQFSIELLGKGDLLREQFDGSKPSLRRMEELGLRYSISLQAAARQLAEQSRQECAVAIAWRSKEGERRLLTHFMKVWCSPSFEERFHWSAGLYPREELQQRLEAVSHATEPSPLVISDKRGPVELASEGLDRHYAVLLLVRPEPVPLFSRVRSLGRPGSPVLRP